MRGQHRTSVWEIDKARKSEEHPTMKPVELYANAYMNNSDEGDVVFDAYGGSGTAVIAAEQVKRKARVVEISPAYCDVICTRYRNLTQVPAILEGTGKTFDDVAAERLGSAIPA
jgi:DNA modification methylase